MKTEKVVLLFLLFILPYNIYCQEITIKVNAKTGSIRTLKQAYDAIENPGNVTYKIIIETDIILGCGDQLLWSKSGSLNHPIYIFSKDNIRKSISRDNQNSKYMIIFQDVDNIHLSYIHFKKCAVGIRFDNVDNSSIKYCVFSGDGTLINQKIFAVLWIGKWDTQGVSPSDYSENNVIAYNLFEKTNAATIDIHQHNSIYVSQGTRNNIIYGNTIRDIDGSGITNNHHYRENNLIVNNIIVLDKTDTVHGIDFWWERGEKDSICSIKNNTITNNFVYNREPRYFTHEVLGEDGLLWRYGGNGEIIWRDEFSNSNNNLDASFCFYGDNIPNDPYWLNYNPGKITDKIVSGDFDGDGETDIAAFYNTDNNTGRIDLWLKRNGENAFDFYEKAWDYPYWYPVANFTNRVVAGDFDGDNKDEIAVFFDYGNGDTRIHVWNLQNNTFNESSWNPGWWRSYSGYTASLINDMVVAGDFNGDGKDDIAAFYENGVQSSLHVFISTGMNFNSPQTSWSSGTFPSTNFKGRVIAGDFDGNNKDEIAVLYQNNSTNCVWYVWKKRTTSNLMDRYNWRSLTSYTANHTNKMIVTGDFNNDNKDDIATFYDDWGTGVYLHVFQSSGAGFYSGETWWSNNSWYPSKNITGRVVSGKFGGDNRSDIAVFFMFSETPSVRSHIWLAKSNNTFSFAYDLGYLWFNNASTLKSTTSKLNILTNEETSNTIENSNILICYPNPFKDQLNITLNITKTEFVNVSVYNANGQLLEQLINRVLEKGEHKLVFDNNYKGILIIHLKTETLFISKKVIAI